MESVIAVITHSQPEREDILKECLSTIETDYPVIIVEGGSSQEIGALERVYKDTDYDEIFMLHDTCHVKDNSLFPLIFETYKGKSVAMSPNFFMLIAKYRREILDKCTFPVVNNKLEGHIKGELAFNREYMNYDPNYLLLTPDFHDGNSTMEEKWGRQNKKLESKYLTKWKGHWDISML